MEKITTTVKSVRMKTELVNHIEIMANQQNRNFSNMVETILLNTVSGSNAKPKWQSK